MISKLKDKFNSSNLIKGSSISFIIRIIGMALGYFLTFTISNYYGASALGIYALSFVFIQMIAMLGRLGMDMALVKFIAEYESKKEYYLIRKVYFMAIKFVIPLSLLLSIAAYYSAPYIAEYIFNKKHLSNYFEIASFAILPYTLIFINTESLRGLHKIKVYMLYQNITTTATILFLLLVAFSYDKNDLYIPVLALVIAITITFILSSFSWKNHLKRQTKSFLKSSKNIISDKGLLSIAIPLTFTSYMSIIMGSTDTVMLGMHATEKEVGIYSVVLKLATASLIVSMAVNTLTVPRFSEYWGQRNIKALKKLSNESTKLILYISLPIFILLWFFPAWILNIFGEDFQAGVTALIILSFGNFSLIIAGPAWQMMNMTEKQKTFFYFSLVSAMTNILLNYFLIPLYGMLGAAIATTTSSLILSIMCIIYIKKVFNILTLYIPFKGIKNE